MNRQWTYLIQKIGNDKELTFAAVNTESLAEYFANEARKLYPHWHIRVSKIPAKHRETIYDAALMCN